MTGLQRFLRFGIAGGAGFIVDAGVLMALTGTLGPVWGRLVSFVLAVLTTWLINRNFAFRDRPSSQKLHVEFGRYLASMMVGGAANWLAYGLVLAFMPPGPLVPLVGVTAGTAAGLFINLFLAQRFVFR